MAITWNDNRDDGIAVVNWKCDSIFVFPVFYDFLGCEIGTMQIPPASSRHMETSAPFNCDFFSNVLHVTEVTPKLLLSSFAHVLHRNHGGERMDRRKKLRERLLQNAHQKRWRKRLKLNALQKKWRITLRLKNHQKRWKHRLWLWLKTLDKRRSKGADITNTKQVKYTCLILTKDVHKTKWVRYTDCLVAKNRVIASNRDAPSVGHQVAGLLMSNGIRLWLITVGEEGRKCESVSQVTNYGNNVGLNTVGGEKDVRDRDECSHFIRSFDMDIGDIDGQKCTDKRYCSDFTDRVKDIDSRGEDSNVMDGNKDSHDRDSCHSCASTDTVVDEIHTENRVKDKKSVTDENSLYVADDERDPDYRNKNTPNVTDGKRDSIDREQQAEISGADTSDSLSTNVIDSRDENSIETGDQARCDDNKVMAVIHGEKVTNPSGSMENLCHITENPSNANHPTMDEVSSVAKKSESSNSNDIKDEVEEMFFAGAMHTMNPQHVTVAMLKSHSGAARQSVPGVIHPELKEEMKRLATFFQFQAALGTFVVPIAKSGFFLLAVSENGQQEVECAFCGVRAAVSLFSGANAMHVHRQLSPQCKFVRGEKVGNVSIAEVAVTSSAFFMEKYSLPAGLPGNNSAGPSDSVPSYKPQTFVGPNAREVLVTDGTAAIMPAVPSSATSNYLGPRPDLSHTGSPSAGSSDRTGETVADSRPESLPGQSSDHQGHAGVQPTTSQQSGNGNDSSLPYISDSSEGNPPAVILAESNETPPPPTFNQPETQASGSIPYQTATVSRPEEPSTLPEEGGQSTATGTGTTQGSGEAGASANTQERQLVTYEQLGIYSQRPKRPDMSVTQLRINTFENWPHRDTHPPAEMAEAGFYYTGHDDLVRCFYCKGGLKTWDSSDKPWVEHCRWFPTCPFIKVCKGPTFVQAVTNLNKTADSSSTISVVGVFREMRHLEAEEDKKESEKNFSKVQMTPDYDTETSDEESDTESNIQERIAKLTEENEELQGDTLCKMCHTNEVNVLFLPCGHLVSCSQCAPALRTCAMCRQPVKGLVRVRMDQKHDSDALREAGWDAGDPDFTRQSSWSSDNPKPPGKGGL